MATDRLPSQYTDQALVNLGRQALEIEQNGIAEVTAHLDGTFAAACRLILAARGRVVLTGMGKSGHIATKISATLASTGTPSFYIHPAEAIHGDIGMITSDDVIVALSYSGENSEIIALIPIFKRLNVKLIAVTGQPHSTMAKQADLHLNAKVPSEACPMNLAPTASTTATLALLDAVAVTVLRMRGFSAEDFARSHPGGSLGRKLLLKVKDVMHHGDAIPAVKPTATISEGLLEMSRKGLGMTAITSADHKLLGLYTDGDLRRTLDKRLDVHVTPLSEVMTRTPVTIDPEAMAIEAVTIMESKRITALVVVDANHHVVGALNVHDLLRAGVM
jgi:arabinose-5-phosphate isomerase